MASREEPGWWKETENPFPRAAIARTSALRPDAPTIPTSAVTQIRQVVSTYVSETLKAGEISESSEFLPDDGRVIVVEGDYGTGKTHLVLEALARVADGRKAGLDPRSYYRVAQGESFLRLYTDLMENGIGADEMLVRVLEFYAEIVAADLRNHPFEEQLVRRLESGEDPRLVISRYGLKEGALLAQLQDRLSLVTRDETFSRALMLLLQPELQEMVWKWFTGGVPVQLLRENGLTKAIDTDNQALESLGVIARIYRRKNRRFILAVDEMEKLVVTWDSSDWGKQQAFKKLLDIFRRTGALLIMAGLPDIFDILPPETQRVDPIINPVDLRSQDVRWYIEESIDAVHDRKVIEPFTAEGIDCIVYLTRGLARDIVRLCYYSYQAAAISGKPITAETVNNVATDRSRKGSGEMVRHEIRRFLADQALSPIESWVFSHLPEVPVDFWIPIGDRDSGCAVLISDSIFDEYQADIIANRITMMRSSDSVLGVIQVVSGYLPGDLRLKLEAALGGEPLIAYSPRTFGSDFTRAVERVIEGAVADAAESFPGDAVLRLLRHETGRLARQQSLMLRLIRRSVGREEQRLSHEEQLLSTVQALTESASEQSPDAEESLSGLPPELERMFSAAEDSLAAYGDLSARVEETFRLAVDAPGASLSMVSRLGDIDGFTPIGVKAFLADLLRGFQRSVGQWFRAREGNAGESTARERDGLRRICQTYDTLYGVAPLYKLDRLPAITSPLDPDDEQPERTARAERTETLRGTCEGLGERVYATAIQLGGGGDPPGQPGS